MRVLHLYALVELFILYYNIYSQPHKILSRINNLEKFLDFQDSWSLVAAKYEQQNLPAPSFYYFQAHKTIFHIETRWSVSAVALAIAKNLALVSSAVVQLLCENNIEKHADHTVAKWQ